MRYKVNVKKTDEGYSICCPGLPGCWSQGDAVEDAINNLKEAAELHIEELGIENISLRKISRRKLELVV